MECHLCGSERIKRLGTAGLKHSSITSDSYLVSTNPFIYLCRVCSHLQKFHTSDESSRIDRLYERYNINHLTNGGERLVFREGHPPVMRTQLVLEQCKAYLPRKGRLMDIGTGRGAILKAAGNVLPDWELEAFDITDKHKEAILQIAFVKSFHSGDIETIIRRRFHLIVLWHVLEHISRPKRLLSILRESLDDEGLLLIQVPDIERAPFDLGVMDHVSHFTKERLINYLYSEGFSLVHDGHDWTHNNVTLVLRRCTEKPAEVNPADWRNRRSENIYHWLNLVCEEFESATENQTYSIFGTGMSSLWTLGQLRKRPESFMDMDQRAVGRRVRGVPIHSPEFLKNASRILMPFTRSTGRILSERLCDTYPGLRKSQFIHSQPDS